MAGDDDGDVSLCDGCAREFDWEETITCDYCGGVFCESCFTGHDCEVEDDDE